ncbi:hypothetical protein ABZ297_06010 [Nonomuraea sp. NPDC005983]|uniref:hypothetical protein n=1 Tax=Nonomuraea sp. NPDC005983 TaxID=3155595 RepID=UPI0033B70590
MATLVASVAHLEAGVDRRGVASEGRGRADPRGGLGDLGLTYRPAARARVR